MINSQLSKQGVRWPASHEVPTQVPIHRGHVFSGVFPLSSYEALNWSQAQVYVFSGSSKVTWSSTKVKYRFVDFFATVPSSFSTVNYKCINGSLYIINGNLYAEPNQRCYGGSCRSLRGILWKLYSQDFVENPKITGKWWKFWFFRNLWDLFCNGITWISTS